MLQPIAVPLQFALLLLTTMAAIFDLKTRRIPNWLSLAGCCSGLAVSGAIGGFSGLRTSSFGLGLGFALYFPLWLLGARGAGDVKLFVAAGSLVGFANTWVLFLLAAVLGGILAVGLILLRGVAQQTVLNMTAILNSLIRLRKPTHTIGSRGALRLPHGLVIFLAAMAEVAILKGVRHG